MRAAFAARQRICISLSSLSQTRRLIRRWRVTIRDRGSLLRICICKRVYWNAWKCANLMRRTGNQTIFFERGIRARMCIRVANSGRTVKHHATFYGKLMVYYASFYGVIQLGDLTRRYNALAYSTSFEISSLRRSRGISTRVSSFRS